jgi:hypothetical protein
MPRYYYSLVVSVRNVCKLHKLHSLECGNYLFNSEWGCDSVLVSLRGGLEDARL